MNIDRALVEKIAFLSRLEVPPAEAEKLVTQLGRIVELVEKLEAANTKGVEPLSHPTGTVDAFRTDEPRPSLPRADVLAQAPDKAEPFFKVPRVVE